MKNDFKLTDISVTDEANFELQEELGSAEALMRLATEGDACLEEILKVLFAKEGVDFSHYRQSTVLRRIVRRMTLGKKSSFAAYLDQLKTDSRELDLLHGDLLLYFTEFFRDPQIFETLKAEIFPLLVKDRTVKNPIRIWVPGCSTGEEVYSLAISLFEFLEANNLEVPAQFFGTDLVAGHIISARAALYPDKIVKHVSSGRLERFFDKTSSGYRVIKHIREMCVFATQDITQDPPFPNIDLLSCRNLLIYFDTTFQDTVIPLFHFALKPTGFLLLGTSETLGRFTQIFSQVDKRHNIFAKRVLAHKQPYRFPVSSPVFNQRVRSQLEPADRVKQAEAGDLTRKIEQLLLARYAPPGVLIDSNLQIRQFHGRTSRYLDPTTGEASLKLSRMAGHSLMPDLYVAIEEAKRERRTVRKRNIPFAAAREQSAIDISVIPVEHDGDSETYFLLLFEEEKAPKTVAGGETEGVGPRDAELQDLRRDLMATKEYLQTIIEEKDEVNQELWTANEEVQSTNEELQSVNEELEAAKEELESSNEELIALNEELHLKNTELTEANALNESTINCSMDGILTFDNDLRVKIWNPAMERMWGMGREMCLDRSLLDLFPFLVESGQQEVLVSVLEGHGAIVENQPYYNRERGTQGFFEGRFSPLWDHNDRIIGGLAVIHDSTERKLAEERLLESEARFKMVMQQSPAAIEIYDLDGLLIGVNRAYEELWQVPASVVVNSFNILRNSEPDKMRLLPYVQRAYGGETVLVPEYRQTCAGGARIGRGEGRWLTTRIYPLKDSGGKVKNIVVAAADVTARKRMEDDLLKIQKLESIGTLAGGIAHDFNNILMGLFGNLALVKNELAPDHPAVEHLIDAQRSMNRATRLTQQLLIFAKGGNPVREGVSIGTLVEEVVRFDLSGSSVKPVFDIDPDLWLVEVDKGQIQQVFSNLTVNAKQAMPEGGHLYISMKNTSVAEGEIADLAARNYVRVVVRDEGEGIDEKFIGMIFDPYFTTRRMGRGLGLATTYSIMKKHGGCIAVESATGGGATFTLYLPVSGTDLLQTGPAGTGEVIDGAGKLRVLVVDDEEMICKVTRRFLEREGFLVTTVQDGREAIECYREALEEDAPYAVVIMDLTIPGGMGGKEAVKKILELDTRARVIVSSGYAEDQVMANYSAYGFCGIAAKPYSREKLLAVVRQALLTNEY